MGANVVEYDYENSKKYGLATSGVNYNGVLVERIDREGPAMDAGDKTYNDDLQCSLHIFCPLRMSVNSKKF